MRRALKTRVCCTLGALLLALAAAPSASAQAQPKRANSAAAEGGEYHDLIEEALREYQSSHWQEAEALFARAHALDPNARTLRGMGLAAFESRNYVRALSYLKAALTEPRNALTRKQRDEVQSVIGRASTYVASFELEIKPAQAQLSLNGTPLQRSESGELLLDPGDYDVVATADGYVTASTRVSAVSGAKGRVVLELVPRDAEPQPVQASQATPPTAAQPEQSTPAAQPSTRKLRFTWVAAGAVPLFAGAAAVAWFTGQSKLSKIEAQCGDKGGCSGAEVAQRVDDAGLHGHQTATSIFLGLSGAALITTGVLFYLEGGFGSDAKPAAQGVALGPRGVTAWGRF